MTMYDPPHPGEFIREVYVAPFEISDSYYFLAGLWKREVLAERERLDEFKSKLREATSRVSKVLEIFYG